ncbi:MAG: metal-dependent transcriptional regulator [Phycisphaerales bacterium]
MAETKQLSESLEDYLEAIYNLSRAGKVARSRDIAQILDVACASVTGALKLLSQRGLIDYEPYGNIYLTEKGLQQAQSVVRRHNIIESFFVNVLGVDKKTAQQAACKAEHALGPIVISRLSSFTDFSSYYIENESDFISDFQKYCRLKGL